MRWYIIDRQSYSENTPQYGHGDWPETIYYLDAFVDAETKRGAQAQYRKLHPAIRFGGQFSPMVCTSEEAKRWFPATKQDDTRLSERHAVRHYETLAVLRA